MNEKDIIFEEVPGGKKMKWNFPEAEQPKPKYPDYIPGKYSSLSEELREKCNPNLFMSPYDYEKVKISNAIFSAIGQCGEDAGRLRTLRRQAIDLLGIRFATETLYTELASQLMPAQFSGDPELLNQANELYQQTLLNADNIEELERIKAAIPKRLADTINAIRAAKKKEEKEERARAQQRRLRLQQEEEQRRREYIKWYIKNFIMFIMKTTLILFLSFGLYMFINLVLYNIYH